MTFERASDERFLFLFRAGRIVCRGRWKKVFFLDAREWNRPGFNFEGDIKVEGG